MRKLKFGLCGLLACATLALSADSFKESDALIAGKDFPFPPDESALPENTPSDDQSYGNSTPAPQGQSKPQSGKAARPQSSTQKPKAGKDIFPPDSE